MELNEAKTIVRTLAEGVNPATGEVFEGNSPYNDPKIIRALFTVGDLARPPRRPKMSIEERRRENLACGRPGNAGLPWSDEDRALVATAFEKRTPFDEVATAIERSYGAIRAELIRQGLIPPDYQG